MFPFFAAAEITQLPPFAKVLFTFPFPVMESPSPSAPSPSPSSMAFLSSAATGSSQPSPLTAFVHAAPFVLTRKAATPLQANVSAPAQQTNTAVRLPQTTTTTTIPVVRAVARKPRTAIVARTAFDAAEVLEALGVTNLTDGACGGMFAHGRARNDAEVTLLRLWFANPVAESRKSGALPPSAALLLTALAHDYVLWARAPNLQEPLGAPEAVQTLQWLRAASVGYTAGTSAPGPVLLQRHGVEGSASSVPTPPTLAFVCRKSVAWREGAGTLQWTALLAGNNAFRIDDAPPRDAASSAKVALSYLSAAVPRPQVDALVAQLEGIGAAACALDMHAAFVAATAAEATPGTSTSTTSSGGGNESRSARGGGRGGDRAAATTTAAEQTTNTTTATTATGPTSRSRRRGDGRRREGGGRGGRGRGGGPGRGGGSGGSGGNNG